VLPPSPVIAITVCKNQKEMKVRTTKIYIFCSRKREIFATIFKILNSVMKSKDTNICLDPLRGLNPGAGFDNLTPQNLEKIVTESCNGRCLEVLGTETAYGKGIVGGAHYTLPSSDPS
jgi:hypothetical protein